MSLIQYRSQELSSLREEVNRLFDLSLPNSRRDAGFFGGLSVSLDVFQDSDQVVVQAEIPGLKKEDINISLQDRALSISGERKADDTAGKRFRSERFAGRFHRSISIATPVDSSKVKATYNDGILTITLPKKEEAKPRKIEVNVS